MRYYTWDVVSRGGARRWGDAHGRYRAHWEKISQALPTSVRRFDQISPLHDLSIDGIETPSPTEVLVRVQFYELRVRGTVKERSGDLPRCAWMSHEIHLGTGGTFELSVIARPQFEFTLRGTDLELRNTMAQKKIVLFDSNQPTPRKKRNGRR